MKVLFVCTGNTCRSPMAEALLKQRLPEVEAKSAGIFALPGQQASKGSLQALKEKGISFDHQSQPVSDHLLSWADLIFTMTTAHKQSLIQTFPMYFEKVFTLKEYLDQDQQAVWKRLKQAYTQLEDKRAAFMKEKREQLSPYELEKSLQQHLQTNINEIQALESQQPNYDVSDPFGNDLEVYKKTLQEIDQYIELLAKKLDNEGKS